jgi:hypothetical protein
MVYPLGLACFGGVLELVRLVAPPSVSQADQRGRCGSSAWTNCWPRGLIKSPFYQGPGLVYARVACPLMANLRSSPPIDIIFVAGWHHTELVRTNDRRGFAGGNGRTPCIKLRCGNDYTSLRQ